jgi:hypothetical protein
MLQVFVAILSHFAAKDATRKAELVAPLPSLKEKVPAFLDISSW